MPESSSFVEYYVRDRVGYVVLNRPEKRNAFNDQLVTDLRTAFEAAEADERVKVVVLKANGKVFSAGADLDGLQTMQRNTRQENTDETLRLAELYGYLYTFPKATIAAVHGHAIAGGCGLATVCDFCFAVPEAQFGYTEVRIGFIPAIVMTFLLRKIGEGRARELLLTGKLITADTAQAFGMINFVVPADELEQRVETFAAELCSSVSAAAVTATKQMMAVLPEMHLRTALYFAAEQNALARETNDCKRGIAAFLNKEKIEW